MLEQTVFIVDDDEAVRDSIKELVESVGLQAETFINAEAFLSAYNTEHPGCLVLDVRMAKMSGLALQKKLNELNVKIPIIFITGHGDVPVAVEAFKAGAVDFIQKPYHDHNLLESINNAIQMNIETLESVSFKEKLSTLTPREQEVMQLLVEGAANKVIAKQLDISPRTVEIHRKHVLQKLGVKSVAELIKVINLS